MTTFYRRLRLRYGLRWQSSLPPMPWREILLAVAVVAAYLLAQYVSDLGDRVAAGADAVQAKDDYRKVMLACLNKGGFYFPDTKKAYACEAIEI